MQQCPARMDAIVTQQLTKRYGPRIGVDGITLRIPQASLYGFLGPNGAGKTTTIRVLMGMLRASSGMANILGQDCWRESARIKRSVGSIPGDLRLPAWMTARSAIEMLSRVRGEDVRSKGRALVDRFELESDVRVRKMSRGMRQKLGLVLALAHDPKLLILDEPTTALDPLMQQTLYDVLRERVAGGATVFFSSHTLSEVEALCERVAIIRRGCIVADESLESLRRRAAHHVRLQWQVRSDPPDRLPEKLRIASRRDRTWEAEWSGPTMELVRWAAAQPLENLEISPPDLERLFRAFYRDEEPAP